MGNSGASFLLPGDLSELQEAFGEGACIYTGTSFIGNSSGEQGFATASFTFYTINCTTGEREEVMLTINGEFLIYLPLPEGNEQENECGEKVESQVECVSGDSLSSIGDQLGCRLIEVLDDQIICGCTHLTAFSALFVPGGGCGGEWEWGILQTVAVTLIVFVGLLMVVFLVVEHHYVFQERKKRIRTKTKRRAGLT